MATRGKARTEEEILQAVIRGNGDKSVIAKELDTSVGQVNNYLFRYPHINDIYKASRRDLKGAKDEANELVEEVPKETEVLTESQKRVIDDIDAKGRGDWVNVEQVPTVVLMKLEGWGLLNLKREDNQWHAKLTDEGYTALITGDFTPKTESQAELKPAVRKAKDEPQKKGGWNNKPKLRPEAILEEKEPINPVIGQEEAPDAFQALRDAWHETEQEPAANGVNGHDCGDCAECLHREVLEYLMANNSDVKELYEHVAAKKQAENKMRTILKKFGG
jgi:hypothetical protein